MDLLVKTMSDWDLVADEILSLATSKEAAVITLRGELGAGKTTLVQALAKKMGISEVVTSPTFTIMKGYTTKATTFDYLVHMDAYRIDNLNELIPLRFSELLNRPNTLICIEWAEKIKAALPKEVVSVSISHHQGEERKVNIEV